MSASRGRWIVAAIIAAHLALAVTLSARLNIWVDEAFSLRTTQQDLAYAIRQGIHFELQPPLYFAVLNVWRNLGDSILVARLLSVVCTAASLVVAAALARRLLPRVHPAWVVAALAFNPFLVWAAVEIRVYALAILLLSLLLLLFHDGFLSDAPRPWCRWLYALVAVAGLYTHYYTGFLLVAGGAALVVLRRWRPLGVYVLAMCAVGAAFAPMLAVVPGQMAVASHAPAEMQSAADVLRFLAWRIEEYLLPARWEALAPYAKWLWRLGAVAVVIALLVRALQFCRGRGASPEPVRIAVWTMLGVTAACFVPLVFQHSRDLLAERHTVTLFLTSAFAIFLLADSLLGRYGAPAYAAVAVVFCVASLADEYRPMAKWGDWQRVAQYLMEHERPQQPVVIFLPGYALPLEVYYQGKNSIVPVPAPEECRVYRPADYALSSPDDIEAALRATEPHAEELWLVTCGPRRFLEIDFRFDHLEAFAQHYDVVQQAGFRNTTVRLLRRRPDTSLSALERQP